MKEIQAILSELNGLLLQATFIIQINIKHKDLSDKWSTRRIDIYYDPNNNEYIAKHTHLKVKNNTLKQVIKDMRKAIIEMLQLD